MHLKKGINKPLKGFPKQIVGHWCLVPAIKAHRGADKFWASADVNSLHLSRVFSLRSIYSLFFWSYFIRMNPNIQFGISNVGKWLHHVCQCHCSTTISQCPLTSKSADPSYHRCISMSIFLPLWKYISAHLFFLGIYRFCWLHFPHEGLMS